MTIRVFEAFSGVGSQRMALRNLGIDHEVVAVSDVDEFTIKSYAAIHDNDKKVSEVSDEEMQDYLEKRNIPLNDKGVRKNLKGKKLKEFYEACIKSNNLGDISKVETHDIPDHDLFTYSFPCFTGDSLVLTDDGYKRIDEINIGDMVLTHTNQYKKVTNVFNQGVKDIVNVKGMAFHNIKTTENHKFLTRERYRTWNNERRSYDRLFHEPQWVEVKDLTKDHYLGLSINQKSELPVWDGYSNSWNTGYGDRTYDTNLITPLLENNNFWWLMGRYVADGWTRSQGGIIIAVPDVKLEELESKVDGLFKYNISKEGSVNKVHISVKELELFVKQFGCYAHGKKVSPEVLSLPVELLKSFIEGYFSGDGSYIESKKLYKCTSVSEELIYGIGQCVAKVYRRPYSIYKDIRPKTHFIEGRVVNQRDTYSLTFKLETGKQDQAFYEDGHIWFPFNGLEFDGQETVYDIEVEDDHSFTVFNTIVHNCQDISVAGKGLGLDEGGDTRSGLLWECQKVIYGKRPKYLLLENVKNLVGKKHKHNFDKWLEWLEGQGYTNYWQVLNAKDYGVPQNRERVFVVSILGHHEPYEFPEPIELKLRLKDMLEDEVEEKFYLDEEKVDKLIINSDKLSVGYIPRTNGTQHQSNTIYKTDTESPSMQARDYKDPVKILIKNGTKKGYLEATHGDGVDLAYPDSKTRRGRVQKGLSQTLDTSDSKGVVIAASRGRNPKNPSDRTVGSPTEQRLEINKQGTSNTITTVQKDNYVVEPSARRDIKEMEKYCEYCSNKLERKRFNGRLEDFGVFNKRKYCNRDCMKKSYVMVGKNNQSWSTAHATARKINELFLNKDSCEICGSEKSLDIHHIDGDWQNNNLDNLMCLCRSCHMKCERRGDKNNNYRIRKLTPLETWRLMGFSDDDFHKAEEVNSNTQLYKQAGNSIVVDVLEGIFKQLLEEQK